MRLLLDENVPMPLHRVLTAFTRNHEIDHLLELPGWSGTRDEKPAPDHIARNRSALGLASSTGEETARCGSI
ncbi:hypothetical protein [Sphaerisporangium rubeum]|uniref:VapC45 PIN like domain-containing protein n=1 Tax=Sphaerisporangium rubeum TaxID=321317 RepID=A0A7X0I9M7_9ACTN|nr:hypothetical protein [Sphaerisporangium rubeum]MBB6471195.1 hypothetical protein [Sphaerisporangium rubeum]